MKSITKKITGLATAGLLILGASSLTFAAVEGTTYTEHLDTISGNKTLNLTVGIGSGAFRLKSDPAGVIYTITDRGPNIKTKDAAKILGLTLSGQDGKIFPTPNFAPSIYKVQITDGKAEVLEKIQLKNRVGKPITGISNPDTENAYDINGKPLPFDPEGVDAEGLVRLHDGTFWIGEEYGPSILHLAQDGRVIERWVPKGVGSTLAGADYEVKEKLPAILRHRPLNRGIESMAVSPDEKYLYFSLQSPLANPTKATYKKSRNVRVFKVDRAAGKIVGEYVYMIDTADSFKKDSLKKKRKQSDVKVSELTAVGQDKLVVLERISKTTKFYLIDLSTGENILGSKWDTLATSPTLEQDKGGDVRYVSKKLLLDSDDRTGMMSKIEGMAWNGDDSWYMVNDSDFGIEGDTTHIIKVSMPVH